ncbi:MAG TPA: radical SAM protein [Candidatus Omnitrophota bacterium]|nr:radical SAM protein [Candidatus Omnitrophota bacterium]
MIKHRYLFFRDDDVYTITTAFLRLHQLHLRYNIPICYAVIPAKLEKNMKEFLLKSKRDYPDLIDIAQHGFMHKNYSLSGNIKYEFGDNRNFRQQKKDIMNGWLQLRSLLGNHISPIFIPPFHGYNTNTIKIVNELATRGTFKIVSCGNKIDIPSQKNFLDLPASIKIVPSNTRDYLRKIVKQTFLETNRTNISGILIHHETLKNHDFKILEQLYRSISKNHSIRTILPSQLIKTKRQEELDITIALTNRCNLMCTHCTIWKEKPKKELSPQIISEMFATLSEHFTVGSIALTGGEIFLHKDIDTIYNTILRFKRLNRNLSVGLYTNGYACNRIFLFLKNHKKQLKNLEIGISLDGLTQFHNNIRGKNNAYKETMLTIHTIIKQYPIVKLQIKTTITPHNYRDIPRLFEFCLKHKVSFLPKLFENQCSNYYHKYGNSTIPPFTQVQKKLIRQIILRLLSNKSAQKSFVLNEPFLKEILLFLKKDTYPDRECYTPAHSIFITATGDVHPCIYQKPLTSLYQPDWEKKLLNSTHCDIIKKGIEQNCPRCLAYHGFLKTGNIS